MCQARLTGQLKKLKISPEDLKTYDDVIQQKMKDGIVEPVPENQMASMSTTYHTTE